MFKDIKIFINKIFSEYRLYDITNMISIEIINRQSKRKKVKLQSEIFYSRYILEVEIIASICDNIVNP